MRKLSLIFGLVLLAALVKAQQNPHGETLAFDCVDCHTTEGWTFSATTAKFSHDSTSFKLEGQHRFTDCKSCHTTLVFSEAKTNCMDCHTDMHNNTLGLDCVRCHDFKSWIVDNITEIHQQSGFPLLGAHNAVDCSSCHTSASQLEFQPLGVECIDCHRQDFLATTSPNHVEAGFSTNCIDCHKIDANQWTSTGFNHDFFPLTKGHEITECATCHTGGLSQSLSPDCFSCHQQDFNTTTNPSHQNLDFSTSCTDCHTTDPGWKPARFDAHDNLYFPIYSGAHRGEWDNCIDCHTQPETYTVFSCTTCHEHNQSSTDREHDEVSGYSYNSTACYACHPTGRGEGAFNHDVTGFPLKGAHIQAQCLDCHTKGYAGTSNLCSSCHINNYNQANNPNHVNAGIATECETCHTEEGWSPSIFSHTATTGFELSGGHAGRQCVDCHLGTTSNASSECISCHQENYNQAENHVAQNYPFDCLQCHSTASWDAASFDHNATNFPLTGAHVATECSACHTNGYSGTSTLCSSCHINNYNGAQNPSHTAAGIPTECENCHQTTTWVPSIFDHSTTTGFALSGGHAGRQCVDCHQGTTSNASSECISCHQENYNQAENHVAQNYPFDCLQCHTTASWAGATFDHNATNFPLTGAHVATECAACHTNGYSGTPTTCVSCHQTNYNATVNPNHNSIGIPTNCDECHTTEPGWQPALFPIHNDYYALNGAHAAVANNCFLCHEGNYTNTSNTCYGCHSADYNNTTDPAHATAQFPTDCQSCHSESAWTPSTFNHDGQYFPIYSGRHQGTWSSCATCHTEPTNYSVFSCITCHEHNKTDTDGHHGDVRNYVYSSTSCYDCHPTGRADD
jgi:hypothetical protein